ncbi:MAG: hypothetical protein U0237_03405 [Thermoleophilia bacterium]
MPRRPFSVPHAIDIVPAPGAPLGRADHTRRWALRFPDGAERFPGIIRPEAEAAAPVMGAMAPSAWATALVRVDLEVVLTDGAGPYLVDAEGTLVLVLGPHPAMGDLRVAMGQPDGATHHLGLVREVAGGVWGWFADARVPSTARVQALDGLVATGSPADVEGWTRVYRGTIPEAGLQ